MSRLRSEILLPLAIAGAVAAQTAGVEASRAVRLHSYFQQSDTAGLRPSVADSSSAAKDSSAVRKDSIGLKEAIDSLSEEDFFFGEESPKDTAPRIFARDTMRVPDSLALSDPFLYKWYVAVKDSFTHRLVVDSLKAGGDSLLWPRIDSLYLADSSAVARERFEKWYAGLSKAERKRYDYEQKLPAIMHRQDSIFHRKDSIKHVKDSILRNTPRILETAFLPDSLYFKRVVSWHHKPLNNKVEVFEWDTTANYHFYDYSFYRDDVGAAWLGMTGSAVQTYNYFLRKPEAGNSFYQPYELWTYSPGTLPMFNTKTPYTELEYYGNLLNSSTQSADAFRVFTTQNILPSLNIALEMKRYGGAGTLKNEKADNKTYFVAGNYVGRRYLAHAGFIHNKINRQESGGIVDNMWIRDTTVDAREIDVNLAAASNNYKKTTVFLDQSYRIPFSFIDRLKHRGDSLWSPSDSLNTDITTGFIGSSHEYTVYSKKYMDNTSTDLSAFYNDVFNINPTKSVDSLRNMKLENRIFLRLQPWREDAVVSKIEAGIGDRLQSFYMYRPSDVLRKPSNDLWNSIYAYAGAEGRISKYFGWDATGLYTFAGKEQNDLLLEANAQINLYPFRRHPNSPISIKAHAETSLRTPDYFVQHFYSNHYAWENDFSKISSTKFFGELDIPRWRLQASVGYGLLSGGIYYNGNGIACQEATPVNVLSAFLRKDFVFGPLHLENRGLFQISSNQDVVPLPMLALNLRWFLQFNIVDPKTMVMQLGANVRYNTAWYAPGFNPVSGTFVNQRVEQYGNCPVIDAFVNMQWKQCCLFIKLENAGNGWPMERHDYFSAHHFILPQRVVKVGISWPFYPRLGNTKTMSARASSGLGGGEGGGMSSLKGALGNFGGGM